MVPITPKKPKWRKLAEPKMEIEPREVVLMLISEPYYVTVILRRTSQNTFYISMHYASMIDQDLYNRFQLLLVETFGSRGLNIYKSAYGPIKTSIMITNKLDIAEIAYNEFINQIDTVEIREICSFNDAIASMIEDLLRK